MDDTTNVEIVDQDPNVVLFAGDGDVVECPDEIIITGKSFSEALFLIQLTHNMTKDCSLNYKFSTYMKIASSEHVVYINCFECQKKKKYV